MSNNKDKQQIIFTGKVDNVMMLIKGMCEWATLGDFIKFQREVFNG